MQTLEELKLEASNLYANGTLSLFADGTSKLDTNFIDYQPIDRDRYYTVKLGDNFRKIAWQFYKNERDNSHFYWHYIVKANGIINPLDIDALIGTEIIIPDLVNFELVYS